MVIAHFYFIGMDSFRISRTFGASRKRLFRAWCDADQFGRWWMPPGSVERFYEFDCRAGGSFLYLRKDVDRVESWERGVYTEVCIPRVVAFSHGCTNAMGEPVAPPRIPFGVDWPKCMMHRATFEDMMGNTLMAVECWPISASPAEWAGFRRGLERLTAWYEAAFLRLEDVVHGAGAFGESLRRPAGRRGDVEHTAG